jgi:O-acetyl-ADP-ribose deacetylase (regulator of RNase III)
MIEYTRGDIFRADAEALVNAVNCVGVMGRGIALQFKNAYPENFKAYKAACDRCEVRAGQMFVFTTGAKNPRHIINFPTKRHWRDSSRLEDIQSGLTDLVHVIRRLDVRSIAVPALGCGLGGLEWSAVRSEMEVTLGTLSEATVCVYEPGSVESTRPTM